MTDKATNLIWFDMEMTGLDPFIEHILEFSIVPTDRNLNVLNEGVTFAIHQPDQILNNMDDWNTNQHTKSGLLEKCRNSTLSLESSVTAAISYIQEYSNHKGSPICGNTVSHDRIFLRRLAPALHESFHYRIIDVSTVKELTHRWYPELPSYKKGETHLSLDDVYESINELKYYRENVLKPQKASP